MVKLIIPMTMEMTKKLIAEKRASDIDTMPGIHSRVKETIREFISNNVGYDNSPIAGLSRYDGGPGELKSVGTNVSNYIPTKSGTVLFELHMPEDMIVSVPFGELLSYSTLIENSKSEEEISLHLEMFESELSLGYEIDEDDEEVISFIPFIDLKRCKLYALVDQSWGIGDLDIPGVEQIRLASMDIF